MGLESRRKPDPVRTANGCAFTKTDVSVVTRHLHRPVAKERLARALAACGHKETFIIGQLHLRVRPLLTSAPHPPTPHSTPPPATTSSPQLSVRTAPARFISLPPNLSFQRRRFLFCLFLCRCLIAMRAVVWEMSEGPRSSYRTANVWQDKSEEWSTQHWGRIKINYNLLL